MATRNGTRARSTKPALVEDEDLDLEDLEEMDLGDEDFGDEGDDFEEIELSGKAQKLLEQITPLNERRKGMYLEVVRNGIGLQRQSKAAALHKTFNWQSFNDRFRKDYSDLALKELIQLAAALGFKTEEDVRHQFNQQRKLRSQRIARKREREED